MFPRRDICSPRRSDMRSPGICVPPPARASTGQTLASAGRDGSPRGRTRPSALAAGTSQPHVMMYRLHYMGTNQPPACLQCLSATRIHDPRAETTNYGAEPSLRSWTPRGRVSPMHVSACLRDGSPRGQKPW